MLIDLPTPEGWKAEFTYPVRPGVELATCRSQVRRPDHQATMRRDMRRAEPVSADRVESSTPLVRESHSVSMKSSRTRLAPDHEDGIVVESVGRRVTALVGVMMRSPRYGSDDSRQSVGDAQPLTGVARPSSADE